MTPAIAVVPIETPGLGDRSYLVHDGRGRVGGRPAARHRPGPRPGGRASRGADHARRSRPTSTTTTSPAGYALARRDRRGVPASTPTTRSRFDRVAVARRRRRRGRRGDAGAGAGTPPGTPTPTCPTRWTARRPAGRRCSPAGRCCTAPPAAPTCSGPDHTHAPGARPVRLRAPAGRRAARRHRGAIRPTGSAASARPPRPRPRLHHRRGDAGQPGADPGRAGLRRRAAGRAGRLPGLLRPHGPGQRRRPGRARPVPARRRPTPTELRAPDRGRRVGGRPARPHRVRRRARGRHAQLRRSTAASPPTWAG